MSTPRNACHIKATVARDASKPILDQLAKLGVVTGHLEAGRCLTLEEKHGFFGIGARTVSVADPVESLSCLVNPALETAVLATIIHTARLETPGRGSVQSEDVSILRSHSLCTENDASVTSEPNLPIPSELAAICCIVQRGQGETIARRALDTGTCVPTVTFGHGTGLRDKLGLLRITIPAEKELVHVVTSVHDADVVLDLLVEAGRLDQPGKGFAYLFPLRRGIVNTRIMRGLPKHAASMEQVIAALDQIKGGTQWRSRSGYSLSNGASATRPRYLEKLVGLVLTCDEGRADNLVRAAMAAGAAGATISRLKHIRPPASPFSAISPAREQCQMIVGEQQVPAIVQALDAAGAFTDTAYGILYAHQVPKACTYLGNA